MSQNELEPQGPQTQEEIDQPRYPYAWPASAQPEGGPRDEPPMTYTTSSTQQGEKSAQVPWWARPQPQQNGTRTLIIAAIISLLLMFLLGAVGIVGLLIGIAGQILGVIIGAITALFVFGVVLIFLLGSLIVYAVRRNSGSTNRDRPRS